MKIAKKWYSIFVAALPLVSVYASGISGFTAGDILIILFFIAAIIFGCRQKKLCIAKETEPILPLCAAIIVVSLFSLLLQANVSIYNVAIRITRREFYYLSVVVVSSLWFDINIAKRAIIILGKIGTLYIALQYILFYGFHFILVGYLPFLPIYHETYTELDYYSLFAKMFRPTSFLLEPAHFSRYMLIPLILMLFDNKRRSKFYWTILFSLAIVFSTSGSGIIALFIVWIVWFGTMIGTGKIPKRKLVPIGLVAIVAFAITRLNVFQSAFYRILNSNLTNVDTAGGARFRGYMRYFELPTIFKIIGKGYGNTPDTTLATWFSGASYLLYGTGIIGFIVCIVMFIKLFFRCTSRTGKMLVIVFLFLFFTDDCFMSHVSIPYLSFICFENRQRKPAEVLNET